MSRLAREELRHFEQVLAILKKRGIPVVNVSASRYASALRDLVRKQEPQRLTDTLVVGAFIERVPASASPPWCRTWTRSWRNSTAVC